MNILNKFFVPCYALFLSFVFMILDYPRLDFPHLFLLHSHYLIWTQFLFTNPSFSLIWIKLLFMITLHFFIFLIMVIDLLVTVNHILLTRLVSKCNQLVCVRAWCWVWLLLIRKQIKIEILANNKFIFVL